MSARRLHLFLAPVLLGALMAGCMDPSNPSGDANGASAPPLKPTGAAPDASPLPGRAALVVVVTTNEFSPVPTAQVLLAGTPITAFTDQAGRVVFNDLDPGAYTALAAKPGYRAAQPKGRVVQLVADEVVETKLELNQVPVVSADNAYSYTYPFRGFIGCSIEWKPPTNPQGARTHPCRGVPVQGTMVGRDPNENSIHPWKVENIQLQTIVQEVVWQPSFEALNNQLYTSVMNRYECNASSCSVSGEAVGGGGKSPIQIRKDEGGTQALTAYFGREANRYPRDAYSEVRNWCPTGCQASATFQQKYDLWTSVFYGQEAPQGFTALAK